MLSLLGFFMETLIATRLLNFPQTRVARER
jgi:hypothetical protein